MKKSLIFFFLAAALVFTGCATSNTSKTNDREEGYRNEEPVVNTKLNNRRLEKNLDRFAQELNLSKKQQKQLKKIDKRYARMERKLSRDDDATRRDRKRLAEEKRVEMIEVLNPDQQQQLEALAKKGRFSLDQLFGR